MSISLTQPLSNAFKRMTAGLFKPFDIGKWFTVGFTAFLAGLTDGPYHGGGGGNVDEFKHWDFYDFLDAPGYAWEWLLQNSFWLFLISAGLLLLIAIVLALTWLSSRGAFMFLDNVVQNRALVTKPWREFKRVGDSVFLWRLVFGLIILFTIILFIILFFTSATLLKSGFSEFPIFLIISLTFLALLTIVVVMYISMFLNNFVIPVMYKNNCLVLEGWHLFLQLFRQNPGSFILYGLFLFLLHLVVIIFVVMAGIFTCCIGFILLIIPYINAVILLPISYTFRAFSVEFLEQFGPDYEIFPRAEAEAPKPKK
jgi:hypothetical protein